MNGANVGNVAVTCTAYYSIGGTISGLTGTLVMRADNVGDNNTFTTNGAFTFGEQSAEGNAYNVTVVTQPAGQTCTVTNGSGTLNANVTNVLVACTTTPPPPQTYTIGGTISGLAASTTVVLQKNGGDNLSRGANGAFTFATPLANGAAYSVTVLTQPAGQTCAVTSGSGNVAGANVTSVSVNCSSNTTDYSIGGTITGLTGAGLEDRRHLGKRGHGRLGRNDVYVARPAREQLRVRHRQYRPSLPVRPAYCSSRTGSSPARTSATWTSAASPT